jgi:hypothetical protein
MNRIIYGTQTGSIEEADQCVIIDLPDGADAEEHVNYGDKVVMQPVVGMDDVRRAVYRVVSVMPHIHPSHLRHIVNAVEAELRGEEWEV